MDPLKKQVGGNHYKQFKIQPLEFAEKLGLSPAHFSAFKYACRLPYKGKLDEDAEKMLHCLQLGEELGCNFMMKDGVDSAYISEFLSQFALEHRTIVISVLTYQIRSFNYMKSITDKYLKQKEVKLND